MDSYLIDRQLHSFLAEDLEHGDITTDAIFDDSAVAQVSLVARQRLVAAGMEKVAARVFTCLGGISASFDRIVQDGNIVEAGETLMQINAPVRVLLRGERVALNLVQRLCAIATLTRQYVDEVAGLNVAITDTRKTTPGLRMLEKYAVRVGGGRNHRYSLSDGVLIKDNHIAACGSITEAVARVRASVPHTIAIEVETDTLEQVEECLACSADIIMLDNMDAPMLIKAVKLINGRSVIEASGGVKLETVRRIAETGVDIISVGALTHSAGSCDIGLDWL